VAARAAALRVEPEARQRRDARRGQQGGLVSGFLDGMAQSSAQRVAAAAARESLAALRERAARLPPPPPLRLSPAGFDVIAEIKLRSPAAGQLGSTTDDWLGRARDYARAGAAAVSVLTEPSRFDGSLEHLELAAAALRPLWGYLASGNVRLRCEVEPIDFSAGSRQGSGHDAGAVCYS